MHSDPAERSRTLLAAKVAGATALSVIAQIAVDMPEGYLGAVDRITRIGATYAASALLLAVVVIRGLRRGEGYGHWLAAALLSVNVGLFVPAVAADPLVGGIVVIWNLALLVQLYFFPRAEVSRSVPAPAAAAPARDAEEWLRGVGPAARHLAGVSLLLAVAVVGYRLSGRLLTEIVCLGLGYGTLIVARRFLWPRMRRGDPGALSVGGLAVLSLALAPGSPGLALSLLAVAQLVFLLLLVGQERGAIEVVRSFYEHPSRLIVASFAGVILLGTVFLTFPAAAADGRAISPIDAFFTATSATCVTGLIVLDTPIDFSPFGQAVILGLIQVGGLGIMVLSTFAALMLGGALGLRGERALSEALDQRTASTAYRLVRFIVASTLAIEAMGAAALTVLFTSTGLPAGEAIWRGVFHAISAFCNAGFALQSDSIVGFRGHPAALLVFGALIVMGGLGFAVLAGVGRVLLGSRERIGIHARTALVASSVLLVAGTALYAGVEWERTLGGMGAGDKLVNALFQSITLRTAGFNSVELGGLAPATAIFMILFMFVGGSPGSTAGGIKTTTMAVLLASIRATVRGEGRARLFRREIPDDIVARSLAILVISAAVVVGGLFLLLLVEPRPFTELFFEAASAFGTVGLSLGATPLLGPVGKLIVIVLMFVGRVGPLTLALFVGTSRGRRSTYRLPEARLMVG